MLALASLWRTRYDYAAVEPFLKKQLILKKQLKS